MLYQAQDVWARLMAPSHFMVSSLRQSLSHPLNPARWLPGNRLLEAQLELLERTTGEYPKPAWALTDGEGFAVLPKPVMEKRFCDLIEFCPATPVAGPKVLVVAPLSGNWATLVRDTVASFLPDHQVFITDWKNARDIPPSQGEFHLDDYVDYLDEFTQFIGDEVSVLAICQATVPVLMLAAVLAERGEDGRLASLVLMGGPVDPRKSPTEVNSYTDGKSLDWFERNVVKPVPDRFAGAGRAVYPGFIQLAGFVSMNFDMHLSRHVQFFEDLVAGDGDSAEKHRQFYNEYLAVMDLPAAYYLETLDRVFLRHLLAKNQMPYRGRILDLGQVTQPSVLTLEAEHDDITGHGQTEAALALLSGIADAKKRHWLQPGVGHYGIFNGSRFRASIAPKIKAFIRFGQWS